MTFPEVEHGDYYKKQAHDMFHLHERFMLRLCEILKIDYTNVTDDDVIAKVQELQTIRDDLTFDPIRQIWVNGYDR